MKVYVFTYQQAVDCKFLGVTNKVFANRDDALKAFKAWRDDEMKYVVRDHWTIGTDKEDYFEAYEEGYYNHNHSEGFVNEYDVEEPSGVPAEKPKRKRPSLDDIVTITCYNQTEEMVRRDAIKFYAEGMACCEGSERDRYTDIYLQLMDGNMVCHD